VRSYVTLRMSVRGCGPSAVVPPGPSRAARRVIAMVSSASSKPRLHTQPGLPVGTTHRSGRMPSFVIVKCGFLSQ
jgi:hypothetical protein